jgi:hypothetical protein
MKIVIKKQLTEASRRNISSTIASRLIKKAAHAIARSNFTDPIRLDITEEMEELKKSSSKFDLKLKQLRIEFYGDWEFGPNGWATSDYVALRFPRLFNAMEQTAYTKALKKQDTEESFKKRLQKVYDKKAAKNASYSRDGKPSPDFLEKESKKFPAFTKVREINDRNIEIYEKFYSAIKYTTPEEVDMNLKIINPGFSNEKLGIVYKYLLKPGKSGTLHSIYSTLIHELKHSRQYKSKEFLKSLFQDKSYLSLPTDFYAPLRRDFKDWKYTVDKFVNPIDTFYYFSRPIEVDARISQYRVDFSLLKKEDPATAGEKIYDRIIPQETINAKAALTAQVKPFNSELHKYIDVMKSEILSKQMYQFLYQLSKTEKNIFNSNPKFEELLQYYSSKVDEVESKIQQIKANHLTTEFNPKERDFLVY